MVLHINIPSGSLQNPYLCWHSVGVLLKSRLDAYEKLLFRLTVRSSPFASVYARMQIRDSFTRVQ